MTEHPGPFTVALDTSGPRDPQYVLEVAEAVSQAVRTLNHLTGDHAALRHPSEADTLLRYLEAAVAGLPQLLDQVGAWLREERAEGRVKVREGKYAGSPDIAAEVTVMRMDQASAYAERMRRALHDATEVTSAMSAPGGSEEGDEGG